MSEEGRGAAAHFGSVFILSISFWILGADLDVKLLSGLPISALAAGLISFWDGCRLALASLLARTLDFRRAGWRLVG